MCPQSLGHQKNGPSPPTRSLFPLVTLAAHFLRFQELPWGLVFNHVTSLGTTFRHMFQEGPLK